jgi:hypothetical protein
VIKDRAQKQMLYRHFRAQGWMAQVEVPIVTLRGVSKSSPLVTDVDVLGFRPSADLKWHLVIGDCKTRRKESPVNRVLWVRGLQEGMRADSSIVLLQREDGSTIERDHKLFADRLNVLLIEEDQFPAYDRAVLYPAGSANFGESIDALQAWQIAISTKFPPLKNFVQWIMCDAWAISDHAVILRTLLGKARDVQGELDPRRDDHFALILEIAAALAIPFAALVGEIFRGYLKPSQRDVLEDAVRMIVWGGREQYELYNALRRQIALVRGVEGSDPLALPAWDDFLELLRAYLEAPHLAFRTSQLFRDVSTHVMSGTSGDPLSRVGDSQLLNLALRLALYLCQAVKLPSDAADKLKRLFTSHISKLVHSQPRAVEKGATQQQLPIPEPSKTQNS